MTPLTFNLPDDLAEEVSHLEDPDKFAAQALTRALRLHEGHEQETEPSKWAQLVARIESQGASLGEYAEAYKQSGREFRRNFRFKHDR
jgi:hypothetical protein